MSTTWVVDSNCFIHLGSMAQDNLLEDLKKSIPQGLYVTPGVHKEVRTHCTYYDLYPIKFRYKNSFIGKIRLEWIKILIYLKVIR